MRSENKNNIEGISRYLGENKFIFVITLLVNSLLLLSFNYIVNVLMNISLIIKDKSFEHFGAENLLLNMTAILESPFLKGLYLVFFAFLLIFSLAMWYQMRQSFSNKTLNQNQEGSAKWTTVKRIKKELKKVPLKDTFYEGMPGFIFSRWREYIYITSELINSLTVGTTRSGKGEMIVFQLIDLCSRVKNILNRSSMIINDPKLELYKACKKILEKRGYIVRFLNLDDPLHSAGYNPLQLVIEHYKAKRLEKAQMAAKTFAFGIFHADKGLEAIWKNTATDLFTALIVAVTTDCLELDKQDNKARLETFKRKQDAYINLNEEEKKEARAKYEKVKSKSKKDIIFLNVIKFIPEEEEFWLTFENEKNINCFSVINFFKELCDRAASSDGEESFEKKAETALDEYFNARPKLDYAASLYNQTKNAGDRAKGSVYLNMQSAISTFNLSSIAKLTAENDIDIKEIGYGNKPVAIFMGTPSEDRSNHFLITTFIAQTYQYLFQLTKEGNGKLKRRVRYILDEFGNFPAIENFASFCTVCLGLGINFDIFVQSYNQITSIYKDDSNTILENFGIQCYIKSLKNDSAESFSKMLGNMSYIDRNRSGKNMDINKSFSDNVKGKPLIHPADLEKLKEGECVIYRGMARKDKLGAATENDPIINEYADSIGAFSHIKILLEMGYKRRVKKEKMEHFEEKRELTFMEERKVRISSMKKYKGTALLYRYEYLTDTFPNPNDINIKDINTEDRTHIDYINRVYEPDKVIERLRSDKKLYEQKAKKQEARLCDVKDFYWIKLALRDEIGENFMELLDIRKEISIEGFINLINGTDLISKKLKNSILARLSREVA